MTGTLWDLFILVVKVVGVFAALMLSVLFTIWLERRIVAFMQTRVGPNRVGPFGVLQSLADGDTAEVDFGEERTARLPVRVAPTVAPGCVFVPANQPDLALRALLGPAPALRVKVTAVEEAAA